MKRLHKGIVVCVSVIGCLLGFLPPADSRAVAQPRLAPVIVALPPNAQGVHNSQVLLPVTLQNVDARAIFAYQFTIRFDPAVLTALDVSTTNTLSAAWSIAENHQTPGELTVAAFHTTPLVSSGRLLTLRFTVVGQPTMQSAMTWQTLLFNEGDPPAQVEDGTFQVAAETITVTPTPTLLPPTVTPPPRATTNPPQRAGYLPIVRR
jgi:hypothetical protein